ncbi:pyruvate ferredoxin oxidoreductase [Candidatus Bathyarchaeota archaeon]|nr:pyruvate ferredoxin oxidoreductase [Candidatus Bathyarchaeota archaeon]
MEILVKQRVLALNGDEAVAYAAKQSNVDVVAAYPVTPQTIIVERFSEYVADGEVDTEFVCVESEHSAMTACITASATGARTFTATAAPGLALMHEMLYVASGCRTPVVMAVANRALSAPLNIHCDHSDSMGQRDSGWIKTYAENSQEAYDSLIQAFRIAEDPEILLPVMVCLDGFTLSHALENVHVLSDDIVKKFVGIREIPRVIAHEKKEGPFRLDPENPLSIGPVAFPDYYFEFKRQQEDAMKKSLKTIKQVHDEYAQISGRHYGDGLIDLYLMDDAEIAAICLGSTAGTVKSVVDELRAEGIKAGLLRIRTFRPLPLKSIAKVLEKMKAVAVMDRSMSFGGGGGPVFQEIRHALYETSNRPLMANYIYGLGGRDISPSQIRGIYSELQDLPKTWKAENRVRYVGLRGQEEEE